jgi:hypothetical protein
MADLVINQTPLFDAAGNMYVHGLGGILLTLEFQNTDGSPRDVSARSMFFVVEGKLKVPFSNTDVVGQKSLDVSQTQVSRVGLKNGKVGPQYVIVDETTTWDVLFEGMLLVRGFLKEPTT